MYASDDIPTSDANFRKQLCCKFKVCLQFSVHESCPVCESLHDIHLSSLLMVVPLSTKVAGFCQNDIYNTDIRRRKRHVKLCIVLLKLFFIALFPPPPPPSP